MTSKDLILISDSIFGESLPSLELLSPERFELRGFGSPNEAIVLGKMKIPRAVVLDLDKGPLSPADVRSFLDGLGTRPAVIGIGSGEILQNPQPFFECGVNAVLAKPIDAPRFRDEVEVILGEKFRRFERKEVTIKLNLTQGTRTWAVTARTVNVECVVVEGRELPPVGANVFVTSAGLDGLSLYLWAHCWKGVKGGLVLRFLNPGQELIDKIQSLPGPAVVEGKKDDAKSTPAAATEPEIFALKPLDLSFICQHLRAALDEKNPSPPWSILTQDFSPFEREALQEKTTLQVHVAKALALRVGMLAQIFGLQERDLDKNSLDAVVALEVMKSHEHLAKECFEKLQEHIQEAAKKEDKDTLAKLNGLKSQLHRTLVAFRRTLQDKGIAAAAPKVKAEPLPVRSPVAKHGSTETPLSVPLVREKRARSSSRSKTILASLLAISVVAAAVNFYLVFAKRGRYRQLTQIEMQSISPYILSASLFEKEGTRSQKIRLTKSFDALDPSAQKETVEKIAAQLLARQIALAVFERANNQFLGMLRDGKVILITKPPPKGPPILTNSK